MAGGGAGSAALWWATYLYSNTITNTWFDLEDSPIAHPE